ncbi:alpha/beta hydrolase [Rhodococcus sp. NPDC058521]|uniref:alpha/beta hydrolase n=1 Tax=Rhodococcus sp. NPDC058521 TaxID=3346536 RepID=UPI003664ECB6
MQFTSETTTSGTLPSGVIERTFTLGDITGVLWLPDSRPIGAPLLLSGHAGGMHKKAPGLVANATQCVATYGFTVAAIDAPGHGDRTRNQQDQYWADAIHQARSAREPIAPIVIDYSLSVAERAVPEWQTTLDALQAMPEIGVDTKVGYGGVTLGVVTGIALAAADSRIAALSLGGVFVNDSLIDSARKVTVPVECRMPWDGDEFERDAGIALFDAFASKEKALHVYSGRDYAIPEHERDNSARFLSRHLVGQPPTA